MTIQRISIIAFISLMLILPFSAIADETDNHVEDLLRSKDPDYRLRVTHIHGAGFDDNDLVIATHLGLLRYQDGEWIEESSPPHDYMGFSLVANGAYVSGHPSILYADEIQNPLGVMFTDDWGANLAPRKYSGEIDFHWLTAGYFTNSVYALTSQNPSTGAPLFTGSLDAGQNWGSLDIIGIRGTLQDIAAHPTESRTVYILTSRGLYVSRRFDGFFLEVLNLDSMKTLAISRDGMDIYLGHQNLVRHSIQNGGLTTLIIPRLNPGESINEIATGPASTGLIAFSTDHNSVFISRDFGRSWERILMDGDATQ